MIELIQTGPQASIQDLGRRGYLAQGVGTAGAMDKVALELANCMLGNPPQAAAVEFTYGGFDLRCHSDITIALTGADCEVRLNGRPVSGWTRLTLRADDRLSAGMARRGMRAYLAVSGGIRVPAVLGSASTDMKGGFGGLHGRALEAGDRLEANRQGPGKERNGEFSLDPALLADFYDASYTRRRRSAFCPPRNMTCSPMRRITPSRRTHGRYSQTATASATGCPARC